MSWQTQTPQARQPRENRHVGQWYQSTGPRLEAKPVPPLSKPDASFFPLRAPPWSSSTAPVWRKVGLGSLPACSGHAAETNDEFLVAYLGMVYFAAPDVGSRWGWLAKCQYPVTCGDKFNL